MPALMIFIYGIAGVRGVAVIGFMLTAFFAYGTVGYLFRWPFCTESSEDLLLEGRGDD